MYIHQLTYRKHSFVMYGSSVYWCNHLLKVASLWSVFVMKLNWKLSWVFCVWMGLYDCSCKPVATLDTILQVYWYMLTVWQPVATLSALLLWWTFGSMCQFLSNTCCYSKTWLSKWNVGSTSWLLVFLVGRTQGFC